MSNKKAAKKEKEEPEKLPEKLEGVYVFPNGDQYDGQLIRLPEGGMERTDTGTHISCDGTVYTGQWVNDKMNGRGVITFSSGSEYCGQFVDNQLCGEGVYKWSDGSMYRGNFLANRMTGCGEYTDVHGRIWHGNFSEHGASGLRLKLS